MRTTLRIGTRGSALALWQANAVAALLAARGYATELITIRTTGDRIQDRPLSEAGGKGLFVKEIEDALLAGTIDLAVHSAKDMSVAIPSGLAVAAVLPREDPRDALVARQGQALRSARTIGTGSVRRAAQLSARMSRACFLPVRGNVDTRLRKLDAGEFDALVLAVAGLTRLGYAARITEAIPADECIPAPGQGIIAIETRADDARDAVWGTIGDRQAAAAFDAERAVVEALGGGCQLPLGAIAIHEGAGLSMHGIVTTPDGTRQARRSIRGAAAEPAALGRRLAAELAEAGAIDILNSLR
ncbi:MAG TPA: hydroxymethylbilane synthase [Vicinamibacterales bacterium]|nr:hydroxymethylbilane synthase [Vicinamibacterales bacterium]